MVKNKKLSKSSIAIIVLALLLIASLVMGMTGAWFTDNQKGSGSSNLTFGKVKVTTGNPAAEAAVSSALYVPGDTYAVAGTVESESDVESYVLITTNAYLQSGEGANAKYYKVYAAETAPEEPAVDVELITNATTFTLGLDSNWTPVGAFDDDGNDETPAITVDGFYNVAAKGAEDVAANTTVTVTVTFTLVGEAFGNNVWLQEITLATGVATGERQEVNLNGNANYKLYVEVKAQAVQAKNIAATVAERPAAAYALLNAGVVANTPVGE